MYAKCYLCGKNVGLADLPGTPQITHSACAMEDVYRSRGEDPAKSPNWGEHYQKSVEKRKQQRGY